MLTEFGIRNLKPKEKVYKVGDGFGLFIVVFPNGNRYWRFKYEFCSEKSLSFGRFPDVGLVEAREMRIAAEKLLKRNLDPSTQRKVAKQSAITEHGDTLKVIADEWFETKRSQWTERHAVKVWQRLEIHVLPKLGDWPINQVKPRDLLAVLRIVESEGATETAHRTLWTCNQIFKYAVIVGAVEHNAAADIGAGLRAHRGKGYPVFSVSELPSFLRKLEASEVRKMDKLATRLLILTALRTGELRRCKWADIQVAACELRVRPEVMKVNNGYEHIVPLSRQAITVLRDLHKLTGHQEWLFPNQSPIKHPYISENVINNVIAKLGYKGKMVGHSFRKLFSTVLNEQEFHSDAIERQLAHVERNKVRAAYNHALHLKTRRYLMQWWADYLDSAFESQNIFVASGTPNIGEFLQQTIPPRALTVCTGEGNGLPPSRDTRCFY